MQTPNAATPIALMPPQTKEQRLAVHIRDAAEATGVPFEFLLAQAKQESRLDPDAKNARSSAMGLFQFTAGTWLDMIKNHGAKYGLEPYADSIQTGRDGKPFVADKEIRKEILELRRDPHLSAVMAGEYAKDNERVLENKLGRQVSTQDLYLAHFLGAGGALKVLKGMGGGDDQPHPPELDPAAKANPTVFHDADGERHSLDTLYRKVERRFRKAMAEAVQLTHTLRPQVDLAALRPEERPDAAAPATVATAPTPVVVAAAVPPPPPAPEPPSALAFLRPEARPEAEAEPEPEAQSQPEPAPPLLTMALPAMDATTPFPARLPPRPQPAEAAPSAFPVKLPPPVAGTKADPVTLSGLLRAIEDKG